MVVGDGVVAPGLLFKPIGRGEEAIYQARLLAYTAAIEAQPQGAAAGASAGGWLAGGNEAEGAAATLQSRSTGQATHAGTGFGGLHPPVSAPMPAATAGPATSGVFYERTPPACGKTEC